MQNAICKSVFIFSLTELIFDNDLTKTLLIMADKAKMVAQSRTVLQVRKANDTMLMLVVNKFEKVIVSKFLKYILTF